MEPCSRAKITTVNLFGVFYVVQGSWNIRREGGGDEKKQGVKEKDGRSDSKAKAKPCIMHHGDVSGGGEAWCVYSIGFQQK